MLNCKNITQKANDYIDRDLSLMARLKFTIHLLICTHCRKYISQMRTIIKTVNMRHSETDLEISDAEVNKIVELIKTKQTK